MFSQTFLFILTVVFVEDLLDHARIGQGRDVPELLGLVLGNFAQDASHDLATSRFGQVLGEQELVRYGVGGDLRLDQVLEVADHGNLVRLAHILLEGHKCVDALAEDVVWVWDDGRLGHVVVLVQRVLDLGRAYSMATL